MKYQKQMTEFRKLTLHLKRLWRNLKHKNRSHFYATHSALLLPPDVEQMSKRAYDSRAREVYWIVLVFDTEWSFFQIHLAKQTP